MLPRNLDGKGSRGIVAREKKVEFIYAGNGVHKPTPESIYIVTQRHYETLI